MVYSRHGGGGVAESSMSGSAGNGKRLRYLKAHSLCYTSSNKAMLPIVLLPESMEAIFIKATTEDVVGDSAERRWRGQQASGLCAEAFLLPTRGMRYLVTQLFSKHLQEQHNFIMLH